MQVGLGFEMGYDISSSRGKFLKKMEEIIPWRQLLSIIEYQYMKNSKVGRKKYSAELMLKIICLQIWYDLSDVAVEEQINDSISFQIFLNTNAQTEQIPDATTIENFRHFLEAQNLQEQLFDKINHILTSQNILMKRGTIVDATIIQSKHKQKIDPEMGRTRKNSKSYYGMKVHVGVDEKSGLIHSVECTPANINDIEKMTDLMHGEEEVIIGDKGYWSKTKKKEFRERGIYSMILHKRVKHRNASPNKLSQKQEKQNKQWSKVRAKVEHVFCVAKSLWRQTKTRYKGMQKNAQRWYMTMGLVNLYKARHLL